MNNRDLTDVIIQPKRPAGDPNWRLYDRLTMMGFPAERWVSRMGHIAITAVEVAVDPDDPFDVGPEYHVSISKNGGRVSAEEIPALLKLFDMEDADEDNHGGGIARNFWKPVAEQYHGYVCPCKDKETAITEEDFIWRPLTKENLELYRGRENGKNILIHRGNPEV